MPAFKGAEIEDLGYDFTKVMPEPIEDIGYTPGPHEIPEPTPIAIAAYFGAYGSMMRANAQRTQSWQDKLDAITPGETESGRAHAAEQREQLTVQYEKWARENAAKTLDSRRQLLAELCSHQPTVAILERLPGRWLDGFEDYMQEQLTGKGMSGTSS